MLRCHLAALLAGTQLLFACATEPGTTAGVPAGTAATGPIQIVESGKVIDSAKGYFLPLNNGTSTVALFSQSTARFTFNNVSSKALTIQTMQIVPDAGVMTEEFSLTDTELKPAPLDASNVKVDVGEGFDFQVRFYPVAGGDRGAKLEIVTDAGKYTLPLAGKGQTAVGLLSRGTVAWEKLFGGATSNELTTGLVADKAGNFYFAANHTAKATPELLVGKVNADGSLAWARMWSGQFKDVSKDPGQNNESGGSADALSLDSDGNLYLAASVSGSTSNNTFFACVLKIDGSTGALAWQKAFGFGAKITGPKQNAEAYGVDASGTNVYVTGTTGANSDGAEAMVLFLALDKADGSVKAKTAIDVAATVNDRGYTVRPDGKGGVYIGGSSAKSAFLLKLDDADSTAKVAWAETVDLGTGGNVNSLDVDKDGGALVALDRRGTDTFFTVAKVGADGKFAWSKVYDAGGLGDRTNVHVVRVVGDSVWVGGRTSAKNYDTVQGDALIVKLATADGALGWATFHYSGKGPETIAEHRVKGLAVVGNSLLIATQVFTGNMNGVRYDGYWYDGLGTLADFSPVATSVQVKANELKDSAVLDASTLGEWKAVPADLKLQDARAKTDGKAPDSDVMLTRIELK